MVRTTLSSSSSLVSVPDGTWCSTDIVSRYLVAWRDLQEGMYSADNAIKDQNRDGKK